MGALKFDKCCGCIELKTGCFIIGYLNLIGIIALLVFSLIAIIGGGVIASQDPDGATSDQKHALQAAGLVLIIVMGIMVLFLVLALAFCIVLLVGLHQNKAGHLKAYLIYSVIFMVMWVITFLTTAVSAPNAGGIARDLISILLNIYFLLVIRSQYFVLRDNRGGPAIYSAA